MIHITKDWSAMHTITCKYIQPEKPTQNTFVERLNSSYRLGALYKYLFENPLHLRKQIKILMEYYKCHKPQDGLGRVSQTEPVKKFYDAARFILNDAGL